MKSEVVVAMVCITVLEAIALLKGIDGTLLSTVIAVLSGMAGYKYGRAQEAQSDKKKYKK